MNSTMQSGTSMAHSEFSPPQQKPTANQPYKQFWHSKSRIENTLFKHSKNHTLLLRHLPPSPYKKQAITKRLQHTIELILRQ